MSAYYNEMDGFAAAWLRELMKAGAIEHGEVDERDIRQITAADLRGFDRCHFFAGIGVWAYALRESGAEAQGIRCWTGSCPCQPFSVAGKRAGASDERHLWPAWFALIRQRRPELVFGEQVASDDGLGWLDLVSSDLENAGYACGAVDTCAAGFGAPILSQRLYFMAQAQHAIGRQKRITRQYGRHGADGQRQKAHSKPGTRSEIRELAEADIAREHGRPSGGQQSVRDVLLEDAGGDMGASASGGFGVHRRAPGRDGFGERAGATNGFWRDAEWIYCRDGFYRPVEPGTFPLAHGIAGRVGRLRGYGNALVAPQAIAFVQACLEEIRSRK